MNQRQELAYIKKSLFDIYGGKCAVPNCKRKFTKGSTIHHLKYKPGEKIYSDFNNPLDYYKYLQPIVCKEHKRFLPLCGKHHWIVELLKKYDPETLQQILQIVYNSR